MQIQGGIKYFKGAQIYQKFLFQGVQKFQQNYPGGPNIGPVRTKNGGPLFVWQHNAHAHTHTHTHTHTHVHTHMHTHS